MDNILKVPPASLQSQSDECKGNMAVLMSGGRLSGGLMSGGRLGYVHVKTCTDSNAHCLRQYDKFVIHRTVKSKNTKRNCKTILISY